MPWRFDFYPVPDAAPLAYAVAGDVLTVGSAAFDLSPLGEGESLPAAALPGAEAWLRSEITRWQGVLRLCVVMPFDAGSGLPRHVRHPGALDMTEGGPVALPTGAASDMGSGEPVAIDWTQKRSHDALAAWREGASLPIVDFALAALNAGLLTAAEAQAWVARDTLPARVEEALAAMPEPARTAARLRALGSATVRRDHPIIARLAAHMGLTDADVDALFGGP